MTTKPILITSLEDLRDPENQRLGNFCEELKLETMSVDYLYDEYDLFQRCHTRNWYPRVWTIWNFYEAKTPIEIVGVTLVNSHRYHQKFDMPELYNLMGCFEYD